MKSLKNNTPFLSDSWLTDFGIWENKKFYLKLIESFINENQEIDGTRFSEEFWRMWSEDYYFKEVLAEEVFDKIKNQELPPVEGFADIIYQLSGYCQFFEPKAYLRDDCQISEEDLRTYAREAFLKIKERYP